MVLPIEYTFIGYWGAMAMKIFGLLFSSWRLVLTIPLCILFFVGLFNKQIEGHLFEKWKGIYPWWSVIAILALILWGLMWEIYERDRDVFSAYKMMVERSNKAEAQLKVGRPILAGIRFVQERIASTNTDLPYGIKVVIQTDTIFQQITFLVKCDGEIGSRDSHLIGAPFQQGGMEIIDKNSFSFTQISPAFTPENPILLKVFSKEPINILEINEIH